MNTLECKLRLLHLRLICGRLISKCIRPLSLIYSQMQKDYEQQLLMPAGDVASGASRKSWRWRGASATKQGVGARYSQIVKRLAERRASQEQQVMSLVEKEKADLTDRLAKLKAQ